MTPRIATVTAASSSAGGQWSAWPVVIIIIIGADIVPLFGANADAVVGA